MCTTLFEPFLYARSNSNDGTRRPGGRELGEYCSVFARRRVLVSRRAYQKHACNNEKRSMAQCTKPIGDRSKHALEQKEIDREVFQLEARLIRLKQLRIALFPISRLPPRNPA